MNILNIMKQAKTDRILRSQIFKIGQKMGLSRKDVKAAISASKENGLKSRNIIISRLDENYLPYNATVTEYYV